ncbi:hypothetical protein ABT288_45980 [Streptomyces sp. NPDC001093]|uniref:hypothetical protein n=1 Tax=Streptomyces sp. NPDC001093 TaxID=3154376 RepID=UPI00331CA5D7
MDRTVPARAKLADFLRRRKAAARLTYEEMAGLARGMPSKATFERAASGTSVPSWKTVDSFITLTTTGEEGYFEGICAALDHGRQLWLGARRATRAPFYVHKAPDPNLIASAADLSRALRHQHVWAGYPTPGEMRQACRQPWLLPYSTTRRIISGDILPVDPDQAIAFLMACHVIQPLDVEPWLAAAVRVLTPGGGTPEKKTIDPWVKAHQVLLAHFHLRQRRPATRAEHDGYQ